ncbi:hypothetical protein, partial [Pseudomonas shahriarae]|uniref:hypothetical protein n=1 Tax=Pseudomonas shahriarae TaxID=2745512 RepID=UPI0023601B58
NGYVHIPKKELCDTYRHRKQARQNGPAPNFHHAFSSINPIPLFYKHKKLIALNGTLFAPICLSRQRDIKTCGMGSGVITPGKAD